MKIETILNAMLEAYEGAVNFTGSIGSKKSRRRMRQYHAFRDRIIRLDERNKMRIAKLDDQVFYLQREISDLEYQWVEDQ